MSTTRIQIALALLPMAAMAAETSSVGSPGLGYVVRGDVPELRAMLGVPGSARFSDPLPLPDGTVAAEVAPGHQWVLAVRAGDAVAYVPGSLTEAAVLPGVPAAWAFSPSGTRAALSYPDRGVVALYSGLPLNPKLESTLVIGSFDAFAAGDNGAFVYRIANQIFTGDGQFLYESASVGPLAFRAGVDSLVVFDGANANLVEVGVGSASSRVLAAGLAFTPDSLFAGRDRVYAGSSAAGTVALIEYADGSSVTQNVTASKIAPSAISGTMLVSVETDGPAWLVNAQGVSFVPAIVKQAVVQ